MRPTTAALMIALVALVCCATVSVEAGQTRKGEESAVAEVAASADSPRASFKLPRLFDFDRFKGLFKKHYASFVEELARKKLFLGRAFRAFISAVSYKHQRSSHYLSINQMSDWTPEEVRKTMLKMGETGISSLVEASNKAFNNGEEEIPAASLEEIENQLRSIVEQHPDEPVVREIVAELEIGSAKRDKRDTSGSESDDESVDDSAVVVVEGEGVVKQRELLSIDDLMRAPESEEVSDKIVGRVPSNNPDYEEPELASLGSEDQSWASWLIGDKQAEFISQLPGANFVGSIIGSLFSPQPPIERAPHPIKRPKSSDDAFERGVLHIGGMQQPISMPMPAHQEDVVVKQKEGLIIDHRKSNCFFQPRSQGKCGSCYIFSTTALYEWAHCKNTGKLVAFSEQYIIDCGTHIGMKGCDGGNEPSVGSFVQLFGLELRSNYPYRERDDECPYGTSELNERRMGYLRVKDGKLVSVPLRRFDSVLKVSPILIAMFTGGHFSEYGGGVDDGAVGCRDQEFGHAMLAVGMGREDGKDYYLIRNSHSVSWGEQGYYKLNKKSKCLVEYGFITGATFKEAENPRYDAQPVRRHYQKHLLSSMSK